jgi:hypothetical protein
MQLLRRVQGLKLRRYWFQRYSLSCYTPGRSSWESFSKRASSIARAGSITGCWHADAAGVEEESETASTAGSKGRFNGKLKLKRVIVCLLSLRLIEKSDR